MNTSTKICSTCQKSKELNDFHIKKSTNDGRDYDCKSCANEKIRKRRKKTKNKAILKYEKTKKGFLVRCYRNMKSRVTGVTKNKNHLYLGLDILDKKTFYKWSLENENFNNLFDDWEKLNYPRKYTQSIDRIDSSKGYILENIQWITFSENCSRVNKNKK